MRDDVPYPTPPDPLAGREDEFGELPPAEARELPPVEPPSAGFIVQLFLVPALIVTVVIGVYLLFGRLASGEQDWRKQLTDVRSDNPHVRWRGAQGLAQMLQADVTADGVRLAENRDVAAELAALLSESLKRASTTEDDHKQQEFLARTLGMLDSPDITFPVLISAMNPAEDRELRKNAIAAVATTANRFHEKGRPLDESVAAPEVIAATSDPDPMIRHVATFALGLFDSPAAHGRLEVLLDHGDELTRINAAIALARHGSVAGVPEFEHVLKSGGKRSGHPGSAASTAGSGEPDGMQQLEELLLLTNTMKAVGELAPQLDDGSRERFVALLEPIVRDHPDARMRIEAEGALAKLEGAR